MELIIGNKNYSSWSLRGWLILKAFGLNFTERKLPLFTDAFYEQLKPYSAIGKVPVLLDQGTAITDSLAICEYVNEQYLAGKAWPSDPLQRAKARALVSEMHAGFFALRNEMPMNCRARRLVDATAEAKADIAKIDQLWSGCLSQAGNESGWLFGEFSIADIFFAPVVLRFQTYGVELSECSKAYMKRVLAHPAVMDWVEGALAEDAVVPEDEMGAPI